MRHTYIIIFIHTHAEIQVSRCKLMEHAVTTQRWHNACRMFIQCADVRCIRGRGGGGEEGEGVVARGPDEESMHTTFLSLS